MNAALMQAELGKLPIWSGDSSKDGYTIEQWADRVDRAAQTANWDDRDTMNFVYNAFRGPALKLLEALKTFGVNDRSWAAVKAELLEAYSRVQTARTTVVNLADLKQAANESITDFGSRVAIIVEDLKQLMPAASRVPQGVTWHADIRGLAGWDAVNAAHKADALQQAADLVRWASFDHLGIQLFVSNLKPILRDELMKAPPATLNAAIKMARSLEKIQLKTDHAPNHAAVTEVQPLTQPQGHDAALDAEIEALSASFQALLKRRNGNNSSRGGRGNGNNQRGQRGRGRGGRGGNTTGYNVCRYCKKPGHLQKVCNSRIKAGAPEVDAQGKPYTNASELEDGGPTDGAGAPLDYSNPWLQQPAPYDYGAAEEIYQHRPDFI
jgi:hypothetical protein